MGTNISDTINLGIISKPVVEKNFVIGQEIDPKLKLIFKCLINFCFLV